MSKRSASALRTTLRLALRELRGGLKGFRIFLACLALGVMAIAGVGSVSRALTDGIAREGRTYLGGDASFSLIHREASAEERQFLERHGTVATIATMRGMARTAQGTSTLVEMKAVDASYPLLGALALDPPMSTTALLTSRDGVHGAAADPALFVRLGLAPGDRIMIGAATFELRAAVRKEPDTLAAGIGFGPRLLVSQEGLRATNLVQPGSLVRWTYRALLPADAATDRAVARFAADARKAFPEAGWEVRTRTNASPQLERQIERFAQFLTFVGLTALVVGGVGVAAAVRTYVDAKRDAIATLKALGASGGRVVAIYLTQVLLLAAAGIAIGATIGAGLPFVIVYFAGEHLPMPLAPALHLDVLALAAAYGAMTALAFALWPLGRAHDVSVSALFRDEVAPQRQRPRWRYVILTVLAIVALAALAVGSAIEPRLAALYIGAIGGIFLLLRLVAALVIQLARRAPRVRWTELRLAITNIHRPGSVTPSLVLSLGLGLALLVTLALIESNLRRQLTGTLPEHAPSFFFVDIPNAESARFDALMRAVAPQATAARVPMLRGRLVALNGVAVEQIKPPPNIAWVLVSDRGITYSDAPPAGSRVVEGAWWPADYAGPPLVSMERKIAEGFGLKVGDPVTVNVLGRNITARIANLRALEWETLGINFVFVFSPATFRAAPHTHMATLTFAGGGGDAEEATILKAVTDSFPSVTAVRVRDVLLAVSAAVGNLITGIRAASLITLVAAALVLAGALAAGHRHRVYDAVILKTLGATRRRLLVAYALEYLLIGLAAAVFGVIAGSLAGWLVVAQAMNLAFVWSPSGVILSALGALIATVCFGLLGTWRALGQPAAPILRSL